MYKDPSWSNLGWLGLDIAASAIPYMPGSYAFKGANAGKNALTSGGHVAGLPAPKIANKVPIVVGENMRRVQAYASEIGAHAYRPWKNNPFDFKLGMKRNERWIKDQMMDGREIIDIGPDFLRRGVTGKNSPFYEMERRSLDGYENYKSVFERNGTKGGVFGFDFF
jgi:hypothetical protein